MSRRGGRKQPNAQVIRVVCTDEGRHKPRLLAQLEFRYGTQVYPEDNEDGTSSHLLRRVSVAANRLGPEGDYAANERAMIKGVRMGCPSCPRDIVLKDTTIEAMFKAAGRAGRSRPDYLRSTSTVDVSTGATVT